MTVNLPQPLFLSTIRDRKLLERIPQLAWLMNDRGEILSANQRWCEYIGRSNGVEWSILAELDETELDRFGGAWEEARRSQEPFEIELQLKSRLGDWEWFKLEIEPDGNELGQTIWIVTATRLGGSAAIPGQQSTQFLEALLAHASDGIVACDAEGRLVLFNRMAQVFHGLPPKPIEPEEWANYYDLYDGDGIRLLTKSEISLYRAWQGESVTSQEMTIKSKLGHARSLLANATAIYSPTGEKLGAVAVMRDITERKQALDALQQSEQKFRAIFDGTFGMIGLLQPDGKIVEMNRTAVKFAGIEEDINWIDRPIWEAPCWSYSPAVQQQLQDAIARAAQGEFIRYEVELMGAENRLVPIDFSLTPIRNDLGEVIFIIPEGRDLIQLKQAQTERLYAEIYNQRLSTAMRLAKAGAWHWDIRTQKIDWTPEFEILFDYEPGSTKQVYSEWLDRVHPDDRVQVEAKLRETLARKLSAYRDEYRIIWRDGQIRWIEAVGELQQDGQGNLEWLSGLVYDITDRKHKEAALRRSEEFIRRVLESNLDCIKVIDLEGRLLYMNDGGQALMEIDDFGTVANTQWLELWQSSEGESAAGAFATALAGGVGRFDGYCATFKGTPKWWEVVVKSILNADGKIDQILSVSRDVTTSKQAESALKASEELFRYTFDQIPMGFCHVALDGTWLQVNRKFCETVGYSKAELLATTFQAITEPADLAQDEAFIEQLLSGEINEGTLEKRYIHKQGHHVWIALTSSVVRDIATAGQMGMPQYFLCAIEDITDRKQLELLNQIQTDDLQHLNHSLMFAQQQLKDRNEELSSFGYIVSHDLKAPLRAIANLSEWIEEDLGDRIVEGDRQQFQLLRQRVKRMDALIDGLLHYSRVGRQELEIEAVDVSQLLTETIDSLIVPPTFQIQVLPPLPTLDTKRILLSQIFANLLSNAIKHHDRADGKIEITAEDLGDRYQFSIADDGPGIPAGAPRDRIFEIFQTLKPSISNANTGIGLALVKKIVEGEGGEIWLDTTEIGARFCFTWLKAQTA
ncbi:PAS domain S-box protein [Chamaesiphon sp.]|uniref:PAS domain S-box protein n=1 Tax=Chamaesiphon sp. TaxID=2814140 RepID=UPI0035931EB5